MSPSALPTIEDVGGRQEFATMEDGTRVRFAWFRLDNPVARTLMLPGFAEFIEKHLETIADLLHRRHEVLCVDWRGQGLSDRALGDRHRGYVPSMELFLSDLRETLEVTEFASGGTTPFTVIGHSMGGHLALRAAAERDALFERVIAVAPMVDILTGHFPRALSPWLARAATVMGMSAWYPPGAGGYGAKAMTFEGNPLTHDGARFQRTHNLIAREPRMALGNPTFAWIDAAFTSISRLKDPAIIAQIQQPVLIIQAGQELIVSNAAQEWLCRKLPNARLVKIDKAKHEILNETDAVRTMFWQEADAFLAG